MPGESPGAHLSPAPSGEPDPADSVISADHTISHFQVSGMVSQWKCVVLSPLLCGTPSAGLGTDTDVHPTGADTMQTSLCVGTSSVDHFRCLTAAPHADLHPHSPTGEATGAEGGKVPKTHGQEVRCSHNVGPGTPSPPCLPMTEIHWAYICSKVEQK